MNFEQKRILKRSCSSFPMGNVYNQLSSTWWIFNSFYHNFFFFSGCWQFLFFVVDGTVYLFFFFFWWNLTKKVWHNSLTVGLGLYFLFQCYALRQFAQCRRWCELPCFVEMFCPPYFSLVFKQTGLRRVSKDISSRHSSNGVAKQKNNFSTKVASWGKNAKLQIPPHVHVG